MFEKLEMAPPDPILGLTDAFKADPNPKKVNLGVGIYKDEAGNTPVFAAVKKAEQQLLATEKTKSYLPIPGAPEYAQAVQEMIFGAAHPIVTGKRAGTAQTPGGTGALRLAGDFLKKLLPNAKVYVSDPTWENHIAVFNEAGFATEKYPYYDAAGKCLAFDKLIASLRAIPAGNIVLLHGCCHNPSGIDPTADQWRQIADVLVANKLFPLIDFAYQGFGRGLNEDAEGLLILCEKCPELIIASSYSKNFGLYNERVGAITVVADSAESANKAFSHMKVTIRRNYSNPPSHGGAIISTIWRDASLKAEWMKELNDACARIHEMRKLFVDTLKAKGVKQDFSFICNQLGMFSFSGLSREQVDTLKAKYGLYIVGSGRINVAGLTKSNIDAVCQAIADVMKG